MEWERCEGVVMKQSRMWIAGAGFALVVAFFLPWFDLGMGRAAQANGWDMVTASELSWLTRLAVGLTPILGLTLLMAGLAGSPNAAT